MSVGYVCPEAQCLLMALDVIENGLLCPNGHFFPYLQGTSAPVFLLKKSYQADNALIFGPKEYDNYLSWLFETFSGEESVLRSNLTALLNLRPGNLVLVAGAGMGNDLPFVAEALEGHGIIYAQDIDETMILEAISRQAKTVNSLGISLCTSVSDATRLPFPNDFFDATFHFGGLNTFNTIDQGISEMHRVTKVGGRVVLGDEGVAPWLRKTQVGEMLINNNPLWSSLPPIDLLPCTVEDVGVSWVLGDCFYVLNFRKSTAPPTINADVTHKGERGGSMRTRFEGALEGIEPELRDRLYDRARFLGVSRVSLLETMARRELEGNV